jgi:hypothetical protein
VRVVSRKEGAIAQRARNGGNDRQRRSQANRGTRDCTLLIDDAVSLATPSGQDGCDSIDRTGSLVWNFG